jgi:hypothetical protein
MTRPPTTGCRRGTAGPDGRRADDRGSRKHERERTRAQTTIDFAIGASVFLLVVAFVLTFVPGMFAPFVGVDRPQTADRVATSVSTDMLSDPSQPSVLNRTCTVGFFDHFENGANVTDSCRFDTGTDDLRTALGVSQFVQVNLTVRTLDGDIQSLTAADGDTVALSAGDPVPTNVGVTTARRSVFLADRTHRLEVHVW